MDKKDELEIVNNFGNQLSLNRVKTEGLFFDRDYRRDETTNQFELVGEKVVVVTQGKVNKVAFGEGQRYRTVEEATEGIKQHWAEYFKNYRAKIKSEAAKEGSRRRQKTYRDNKRARAEGVKRQQ